MIATRRACRAWHPVVILMLVLAVGCSQPRHELVPIPATAMNDLEPSVHKAVDRAQAEVDRVAASKPSDDELANAYGNLAMTYHAQSLVPAAEAAYANARMLAPRDKRWPYLEGHLYNDSSRVPEALAAFEAAMAIDGNDVAILFSLGEAYLQHGDIDKAQQMYEKLQSNEGARAAALTGLGKVALAKRQYKEAAGYLEEALKLWPTATRIRQPLAMAYQGMGDRAKAEENLRQYSVDGVEPEIVDPMADALGAKVAASRALLRRGQRFGRAGRFDLAEPAFRAAMEADPKSAEAVANLGISLANLGRLEEAQHELERSLAMDDSNTLAQFSLGVILDRQGRDEAAIAQYGKALAQDPANIQAIVYLADAKMRVGQATDAARLYKQALDRSPGSPRMQLSLALAEVKAGQYNEARKILESALLAQPDNPDFINALARILATAQTTFVRDGPRALALAKSLFDRTKNPEVGQTYAMALAETGHFDQAIVLQKETIIMFEHNGGEQRKPFLQRNLALYEQHKATREGWSADDPAFQPRSPAARLAKAS
jgi:tetratricopeptide (TPR) repeat protein